MEDSTLAENKGKSFKEFLATYVPKDREISPYDVTETIETNISVEEEMSTR